MNPGHSVAELPATTDSPRLGTAFAVGPSLALTAFHCVRGRDRVLLRFVDHIPIATIVRDESGIDDENDVALLQLTDRLPESVPLVSLEAGTDDDARVVAIGFPLALAAPRFVVGGTVHDAHAEHPPRDDMQSVQIVTSSGSARRPFRALPFEECGWSHCLQVHPTTE